MPDPKLPPDQDGPVDWPYEPMPVAALEGSVIDRFEAIARRFAGRLAVSDGVREFTYGEVISDMRRIAWATEAAVEARPGPVAILLANEARYPAAMLGALAAGRAYVGLDVDHPEERNARIAKNAGVAAVISAGTAAMKARQLFPDIPVIDIETTGETPPRALRRTGPDDLAWIVYTSGSTGEPKGAYQNHRGLLFDIMQSIEQLHLSCEDRQILVASPSLLSGARMSFGALLSGGSIHCLLPHQTEAHVIADIVRRAGITVFRSVPAVFRNAVDGLASGERFASIRLVLLGGDRVDPSDYSAFAMACRPDAVFGTHLGSTEGASLYLLCFFRQGATIEGPRMPVGRPVTERHVRLIDDDGNPVADGEIGEFVFASRYIALGYWNAPALTAAAFAVDPDDPGVRSFRTGDLGRRRPDGLYEHHGRKDHQIKLHGYRIEPGDIENGLRACQGVRDGAVVVRRNAAGVPRAIAAHVELQPDTRGLLPRHLRTMLARLLPRHMMPATIHLIDALPRLPNLKIDRVRLAAVDAELASRPPESDRDEIVAEVARIFEAELEVGGASADDNVFSLGGDSLQAITIAVALEKRFGIRFPIDDEPATIGELAARIAGSRAGALELEPDA